ncbi:uncharacterized protein HMPREF1541_01043 [Cyphellophora europaea CBS 101466]|uniref:Uncharacterized protein n=1 Tax=Cyphellophora europaea (strain CBS 101466) TaxID=1220924 RepID=W2SG41_CYPE1|nr:uncharacterized protein HMPREF1541_01043 [Cyphellophora europaea CBS 101466]ETN46854.1 hypothetical protein HMPREF1541_01043 [Cyphellophora europaea CBS 101466]
MPATVASRLALRTSRQVARGQFRRQASTASETAAKAKDSASSTVSKASEGLSRVTSSAGPAISNAATSARNALGRVGGRTGRLISFVESLIPPTIYYSRVGLELAKFTIQGQKMAPPSVAQFQSYFAPVTNALRQPTTLVNRISSYDPVATLNTIRNVNRQQLAQFGVVGAEILGFFTVGTMIGRMKVVGYHGEPAHGH